METTGSVTLWIKQLRQGEETALAKLHQRYWPRLVALAHHKLNTVPILSTQDEDVAQEAFWCFFNSIQTGKLPRLTNRHQLFAFLTHVTACRATNVIVREVGTDKRGKHRLSPESQLLELLQSDEPSPVEQAILNDCYRHFIDELEDRLRPFAELYLAGYTHRQIADHLSCVERTVERKIALILEKWHAKVEAAAEIG
jgi:RNA polymerase sigma factor (sigma-70 family)